MKLTKWNDVRNPVQISCNDWASSKAAHLKLSLIATFPTVIVSLVEFLHGIFQLRISDLSVTTDQRLQYSIMDEGILVLYTKVIGVFSCI